jgi:outer membrane protein OmpA-like peptidoglycan-associated protein
VQLIARYLLSEGKIAPYLQAGLHATFGKTAVYASGACLTTGPCEEESRTSFGPLVGVGLDFLINENTSFFVEFGSNLTFGDDAADGYEDGGFGPFDFLGATSIGLKLNLTRFTPVEVTDLVCPADEVETDAPITFSAMVNENATKPVDGMWDFGDGNTAPGLTATHTFARAGSYNVVFTATNGKGKGSSSRTCPVTVVPACEAAAIVSMRASSTSPDTQTDVRFTANVTGTSPMTYRWDFGDGNTSSSANPSHTYSRAGTYTVTLEVTNCGGTVRRTMTITVTPYEAAICREITEMTSVYFDRNASTLSGEARQGLNENLQILQQCPNLNVRVEGLAAPGERMPQELSEDRARAVEQFYVDNGIPASRIMTVGLGRATGLTSKKEGLAGYRRVDTIPVR